MEKDKSPMEASRWDRLNVKAHVAQSCLTLCNPTDFTAHGILQARILEWVAFPFSRGFSQPRDWTQVSCTEGGFFTSWATRLPNNTIVGSLSLLQGIFLTLPDLLNGHLSLGIMFLRLIHVASSISSSFQCGVVLDHMNISVYSSIHNFSGHFIPEMWISTKPKGLLCRSLEVIPPPPTLSVCMCLCVCIYLLFGTLFCQFQPPPPAKTPFFKWSTQRDRWALF